MTLSPVLPRQEEIAREEATLDACTRFLELKKPLDEWPSDLQSAFFGARCDTELGSPREERNARDLRRNLFRGKAGMLGKREFRLLPAAVRVRADLAVLLPLGAGMYLTNTPAIETTA